jgi:Site-specific recombinase XerD
MATSRMKATKGGKQFYEIRVRISREKPEYTTRWYIPDGWSRKAIDRELAKQEADFERCCKAGEVLSRKEEKERRLLEEQKEAAIQTVRQYGEKVFMPSKAVTVSENTRSSFQRTLDRIIYPAIGDLKMPDVSSAQITALLLDYQSTGKALSSCVKVYTVLTLLFKMAYQTDTILRNPMDKVERPKLRKDEEKKSEVEAYTPEELRYILHCLDNEPLKWRAMIRLMIDTGIRRGECCGLQWKYVDTKSCSITIAHSLGYTPEKGIYLGTTKGKKRRTLVISPEVMDLLRQLRKEQAETAISPFVFSQDGSAEPIHPTSPEHYMRKFAKRYGIENLHPHKLRHSFASVALTNNADPASVSEILGHADPSITLRVYTHANAESMKRAGDIFREALKEKTEESAQ